MVPGVAQDCPQIMTTLLIVESPGKIKKLRAILGPEYTIAASVGHVRDMPIHDVGVEPPDFIPKYEMTERGREVIRKLKVEAAAADRVLLASDPDREGEAIAWHLAQCLKLKTVERVVFHAIEPDAVRRGLDEPRPLDKNLVAAQEARRVADRIIGYLVSRPLSDVVGQPVSAGRVQSPAVRLVVEREAAIQSFGQVKHYAVGLAFAGDQGPWWAWWDDETYRPKGAAHMTDRALAEAIAATRRVRVLDAATTEQDAPPPPPFTTTTLQKAAQARIRLKPKPAMTAAQRLYEQGAITYHRTDDPNLSPEGYASLRTWADSTGLRLSPEPRRWKARSSAQEAHEAIRPTHWDAETAGETAEEQALYRLIRQRAIASQMPPARWRTYAVTLEGVDVIAGRKPRFVARHKTLIEEGWKALQDATEREEEDRPDSSGDETETAPGPSGPTPTDVNEDARRNPVPKQTVGTEHDARDRAVKEKSTKPPPRFRQATLVEEMERLGIGRPSTYAAILDKITTRGYVQEDKAGRLSPTETGTQLVRALIGHHGFIDLDYTRLMEEGLDAVARGQAGYRDVVMHIHGTIVHDNQVWAQTHKPAHPCPVCGKPMRRIGTKKPGKDAFFWGCTGYPECRETCPDEEGHPGVRRPRSGPAPTAQPGVVFACPTCGQPMRQRSGSKGLFWGCSAYPACKTTRNDDHGRPADR